MKTLLLVLATSLCIVGMSGCKGGAKYVDDVIKAVDDKVDDAARANTGSKFRYKPRTVVCTYCTNGYVYDYGYASKCQNCGGDGRVTIYEKVFD